MPVNHFRPIVPIQPVDFLAEHDLAAFNVGLAEPFDRALKFSFNDSSMIMDGVEE